jgi:uncharacterized membrane protein
MTQSPSEHKSIASGAMAPIQFTGAIVGAALAGFGAITVGLFDGTSADHVFTQQAASQSGSMLLLAFAAFAAMTVLAAANLRILRDENASEIVNSGA